MERTLNEYSQLEVQLKNELTAIQNMDEQLLTDWEAKVQQFLDDLRDGIRGLNAEPASEDEWLESIVMKQHIVQLLVERVDIDVNRQMTVTIQLNLMELLEESRRNGGSSNESSQGRMGGHSTRSDSTRKHSLFGGRSSYVSVSAIWKY